MNNYRTIKKIGSGNFAKVYLAVHKTSGQHVALKLVDKRGNKNATTVRRISREIENMKTLEGHKNIVSVVDSFEDSKNFGIAMEYVPNGELFDFVQMEEGMSERSARDMLKKIINGVQHCHKKGITHRDLKLENILLDEFHEPKIADFGFSKNIPSAPLTASSVGSPLYSSPEIIQGKPYKGPECDVWSLGVILYVMLTATMPFDDNNISQFLVKVENGDYPEPCGNSDAAKDLISQMLDPNPATRITIDDILIHPWMTELSKKPSPLNSKKQRRQAVCYENTEYIHRALEELNKCDCSCHRSSSSSSSPSFMSRHCEDCNDVVANNPEIMQRRANRLSRNSSISSGYGSEMGSQYLQTPSPRGSQVNILGMHLLSPEVRRHSMPRKSSAGTIRSNSTITSQHRCSVPVKTPLVLSEDSASEEEDDEDVVFV